MCLLGKDGFCEKGHPKESGYFDTFNVYLQVLLNNRGTDQEYQFCNPSECCKVKDNKDNFWEN